ncbi:type II toxin-antitoxin system prevent-host-death family antitoxin [Streptomyces sp. NPDC046939]|uniref:type II toxin-antitoxin system prevent-host-death family antitoxin n=1 Tax=Streptomyces sp. NPDC046939 TaxID=3155376 RepID=UPI0033DA6D50
MTEVTPSQARPDPAALVRRAAHARETIALTDGHVPARLLSPQVREDLEDALAIAERERRAAQGVPGEAIGHDEVGRMLGLRP